MVSNSQLKSQSVSYDLCTVVFYCGFNWPTSDLFSSSFSAPCFPETNWEAHGENKQRLNAELIKGQSLLKVQGSCFCCFQSFALTRTPNGFINLPQIANSNKVVDCLRICFGSWRLVCSWDRVWVQTRSLAGFYCPARAHLCSSFFMVVLGSNSYMIFPHSMSLRSRGQPYGLKEMSNVLTAALNF